MKEYNRYIIEKVDDGNCVRDYIRKKLLFSRATLVKLKNCKGILLNGNITFADKSLSEGDILELILKEEESTSIVPEQIDLKIVFEDEYIIVIDKPSNMPVHPSRNYLTGTLANGLAFYLQKNNIKTKIRPVNRLDKDTTGLVVFAKNPHIQHLLSNNNKNDFHKEYIAIVGGNPQNVSGIINQPIDREKPFSMRRVVREDGDIAITNYRVIKQYDGYASLSISLETGRTHQIRVHMAHIGHPLLGDSLYEGNCDKIKRHALHVFLIKLLHPITKVNLSFESLIPTDMGQLL